jgi:hypothetical protein
MPWRGASLPLDAIAPYVRLAFEETIMEAGDDAAGWT